MEENKICPIMSRPCDEDPIHDEEDKELVERNGFVIINNIPWRNIFPCVHEKCMAWVPIKYRCQLAWASTCDDEDGDACDIDTCPKCVKAVHIEGYCKLVSRGDDE